MIQGTINYKSGGLSNRVINRIINNLKEIYFGDDFENMFCSIESGWNKIDMMESWICNYKDLKYVTFVPDLFLVRVKAAISKNPTADSPLGRNAVGFLYCINLLLRVVHCHFLCTNHSYNITRIVLTFGGDIRLCHIAYSFCFPNSTKNEVLNIYTFGINQS